MLKGTKILRIMDISKPFERRGDCPLIPTSYQIKLLSHYSNSTTNTNSSTGGTELRDANSSELSLCSSEMTISLG